MKVWLIAGKLEERSNEEISNLKGELQPSNERKVASEMKLGELEQRLAHQSECLEERTGLIGSNADRSKANRSAMWYTVGDKSEIEAPSDAF